MKNQDSNLVFLSQDETENFKQFDFNVSLYAETLQEAEVKLESLLIIENNFEYDDLTGLALFIDQEPEKFEVIKNIMLEIQKGTPMLQIAKLIKDKTGVDILKLAMKEFGIGF